MPQRFIHPFPSLPVWHQAWIYHDITLQLCASYCLLFFISPPAIHLSLDLAVSGFVCVCLSACSSSLLTFIWDGCYCHDCISYQGNEMKSSSLSKWFSRVYSQYTQRYTTHCRCRTSLWYNNVISFLNYWLLVDNETRKHSESAIIHQVRPPYLAVLKNPFKKILQTHWVSPKLNHLIVGQRHIIKNSQ